MSWMRSLHARNLFASTQSTYRAGAEQLINYLATRGIREPGQVTWAVLEDWVAELVATHSPATAAASNRYRAVQHWFKWLVEEEEIDTDPMGRMRPPQVPEQPVPVLPADQLKKVLAVCAGKDFRSRRDTAIIRLFIDSGMRLGELAGLTLDDLDLTRTSPWSPARAAAPAPARSAPRPPWPSTGTCGQAAGSRAPAP
jgi:integrase/recombinase XerC